MRSNLPQNKFVTNGYYLINSLDEHFSVGIALGGGAAVKCSAGGCLPYLLWVVELYVVRVDVFHIHCG